MGEKLGLKEKFWELSNVKKDFKRQQLNQEHEDGRLKQEHNLKLAEIEDKQRQRE